MSNLVMVLPTYLPESFGGAEQQSRRLSAALARRGIHVTILAPRLQSSTPAREQDGDVHIRRFRLWSAPNLGGRHFGSYLAWGAQILGWLYRHRSELDVIHVIHGRLHAVPAVLGGALLGKPVVVKLGRGGNHFDLRDVQRKRLLGRTFARVIARFTTAYVANSAEIVEDLESWSIDADRVHRIPNGVEIPEVRPTTNDVGDLRFIFLGRLDREKALDVMLRAFAQVAKSVRGHLSIVGDGPCRRELEILARELAIEDRVTFTGAVADVRPLLRDADVYVSTSLSEGMSNAMLEAMSFGVVPVVTRVSGVGDIVEDGTSGFVCEPGSVDAFARKLDQVLALPRATRLAMGQAARDVVEQTFSIESVADRHIALYELLHDEAAG